MTAKTEPMTAGMNGQHYVDIKKCIQDDKLWNERHKATLLKVFEDTILEHGTQKAEVDRLATALVAANAELVTERAAHAEIKAQLLATQQARYRIMCERDEAERKLSALQGLLRERPEDVADLNYIGSGEYVAVETEAYTAWSAKVDAGSKP